MVAVYGEDWQPYVEVGILKIDTPALPAILSG